MRQFWRCAVANFDNLWLMACKAKNDRYTEAFEIVAKAKRAEAVRCGKAALRKMRGQEKTIPRMYAMSACIKAVTEQDFYLLPLWAQRL